MSTKKTSSLKKEDQNTISSAKIVYVPWKKKKVPQKDTVYYYDVIDPRYRSAQLPDGI